MNLREFDRKHHHVLTVVAIVLSVLIVALFFILWSQPKPAPEPQPVVEPSPPVCTTDECFLEHANMCTSAEYTKQIKTGLFKLSISSDCTLTKTLVSLVETEPERVKNLLEGKSMQCKYEQGNFNVGYVELFTGNVLLCEGPLRNAIESIADQ